MKADVRQIEYEDALFAPILNEAAVEGGTFLFRLRDEWKSGALRFEAPGECLLGAFYDDVLIGVAGLSRDPYQPAAGRGRVRHVYVLARHRSKGVGRLLVGEVVARAQGAFDHLRLSTQRPEAAMLYESMGFARTDEPHQTHLLQLAAPAR